MNTESAPRPYDWADDPDDLGEPTALVGRQRLARLDNGTRPFTVHAHATSLN